MICAGKYEMPQEADFHGYCFSPQTTGQKKKKKLPFMQVRKQPGIPTASLNSLAEILQYRPTVGGLKL